MRVNFYLSKKKGNEHGFILASFHWRGHRLMITTSESIKIINWNKKRKGTDYVLKSEDWAVHINQRLSDIKSWAGEIHYDFLKKNLILDKSVFEAMYRKRFLAKETTPEPGGLTILQVVKQALEFKKLTVRQLSYRAYQSVYNHFDSYVTQNSLLSLSVFTREVCVDFEKYLVRKFKSNTTINNYTAYFTILLNLAVKMNILKENPYRRNVYQMQEKIHLSYDDKKAEEVLGHLEKRDPAMKRFCQFVFYSFARPVEICRLKIADINFDQKILFVSALGKNKVNRPVEILDPFMKLIDEMKLRDYPADFYIFSRRGIPGPVPAERIHFTLAFRKYMDEISFAKTYTMYSFKHFGVIKHFLAGYDLRWLQDQCGHSDINMTANYLRSMGLKINRARNLDAPTI